MKKKDDYPYLKLTLLHDNDIRWHLLTQSVMMTTIVQDFEKEPRMENVPKQTLWKLIEKPPFSNGEEYLSALRERGYRVSDWIENIVSQSNFITPIKWPQPLVRVSLASLGFTGPTHLSEFYEMAVGALGAGLENPTPETALALRFIYDEQQTGEWLRVATKLDAMIDSDGVPHLPKLGKALDRYYIETYWAYPHAVFHPHNEFVFIDRRLG